MGLLDRFLRPLSPDRFAARLIASLRAAGDARQSTYDAEQFRISFEGHGYANLHNYYAEHCHLPWRERKRHLRQVVRGLLAVHKSAPEEFEDARHDLLPVVRTRAQFAIQQLSLRGEKGFVEPPFLPLGEHLGAYLVYDLPEKMEYLSAEQFDDWGVSFYQAFEIARDNLESIDIPVALLECGLYVCMKGDNYDSSRLLVRKLVEGLEVQGPLVALAPNRNTLLLTGADNAEGLAAMAEFAETALGEPRPLSGGALAYADGEWQDWLPPANDPLYERFHRLLLNTLAQCYADQKGALDALHAERQEDVFTASYVIAEKDGVSFSYAVFPPLPGTLLPVAERLALLDPQTEEPLLVPWSTAIEFFGDLLSPTEHHPARYRVEAFPDAVQLEQLRDAPTDG